MSAPSPSASGTLARTPLPHLLVYLLEKQITGTIELSSPDGTRATILVLEGYPSKARLVGADGAEESRELVLGQVMLEAALVTQEQLDASRAQLAAASGKLHGQVMLEMGHVDQAKLLEGLRLQVVQKIESLYAWPAETTFAYFDAFDALASYGADDMVTVDPLPLVWGSIKQAPSWEHVHQTLSRVGSAPLRLAAAAQIERLGLTGDERAFVELLRPRPRRLYEMTAAGTIGPSAKQLLVYCLLITKQVDMLSEDVARQIRPSVPPPQLSAAPPRPEAPPSAVARVQLQSRSVKPAGAIEELRAPEAIRRDRRASNPVITPVPPAAIESAIAEVTKGLSSAPPAAPPPKSPAPPAPGPTSAPKQPASAPSGELAPDLAEQRAKILQRAEEITRQNYFQMLGVSRDATTDEIQKAYFLLAKVWHPDRLPPAIKDVKDQCTKVFAHISEAHQTLTDGQRRDHYMTLMKDGGATPDEQQQVVSVLEAATNFQKAEICVRRNDMAQAEQFCRMALDADPKQADYLALLAWLEATKPENQSKDATEARVAMLESALKLNDKCERAYYYRGMLNKRLGNDRGAYKDFKMASDLNPRNIDAQREVRIYAMRKKGTSTVPPPPPGGAGRGPKKPSDPPAGGGIFGRLFKK